MRALAGCLAVRCATPSARGRIHTPKVHFKEVLLRQVDAACCLCGELVTLCVPVWMQLHAQSLPCSLNLLFGRFTDSKVEAERLKRAKVLCPLLCERPAADNLVHALHSTHILISGMERRQRSRLYRLRSLLYCRKLGR